MATAGEFPVEGIEHCDLTFLQRFQPTSSLHILKEIQAHSLVTLGRASAVFRYEEF
jgi:hypothetical protein